MATRRLPLAYWNLREGDEGLCLGSLSLPSLARRYGTPFYLFDQTRLRTNARRFKETAERVFRHCRLYYSFKTNPLPRVARLLREEGYGAEVISGWELERALRLGFEGREIVFNGPGKSREELLEAVRVGALVQIDSESEALALIRICRTLNRQVVVGIRVNPVGAVTPWSSVQMSGPESPFGLDPTGRPFARVVRLLREEPRCRFFSLSVHVGTGLQRVEIFRELSVALAQVYRDLKGKGMAPEAVNFGGGYGLISEVRYFGVGRDELEVLEEPPVPPPEALPSLEEVFRGLKEPWSPGPPPLFLLEPGRSLVGDTFHLVTRVIRLKEEKGKRFAVLDASRVQNAFFTTRGFHEVVLVNRPRAGPQEEYILVGPLCANFDRFARRRLPRLREGELIALLDVGAYNLSIQSSWSFPPAFVLAVEGERVERMEKGNLGDDTPDPQRP